MRLKRLELFGFKSFARKTVLRFDPGVTCVVGPNGCGKSNVVDAIRWVLGEQSAKSLRGSRMGDVLFLGSTKSPAAEFAEVSIVFEDVSDQLLVRLGLAKESMLHTELLVSRRLNRQGDSEYRVNGMKVRLKDVQLLFLDTGLGKASFSIFEQGKLDRIINDSPLERMVIFEELAGVLRFKQQKKDSLSRLEQCQAHVDRLSELDAELQRQHAALSRQAKDAKAYQENKTRLIDLEKGLYSRKRAAFKQKQHELRDKKASIQIQLQEHESALLLQEHLVSEGKKTQDDLETVQRDLRETKVRSEGLVELKEMELKKAEETRTLTVRRLQEISEKMKAFEETLQTVQKEQNTHTIVLNQLRSEKEAMSSQTQASSAKLKKCQEVLEEHRKAISECNKSHVALFQKDKELSFAASSRLAALRQAEEKIESFDALLKSKNERLKELDGIVAREEEKLSQKSKDVDTHKQKIATYKQQLSELFSLTENSIASQRSCEMSLTQCMAAADALEQIQRSMETLSQDTKKILKECKDARPALLANVLTVHNDAIKAVSSALRPYSQTLVVQTKAEAETLLAFAKTHRLTDFSLLCEEAVSRQIHEESKSLSSVLEGIYGQFFTNTLVVSQDPQIGQTNAVSLSGVFVDACSVYFAGPPQNSAFLRQAEIEEKKKLAKGFEKEIKEREQQIQALKESRKKTQKELSDEEALFRKAEMQLVEINFAKQHALSEKKSIENQLSGQESEKGALHKAKDTAKSSLAQIESERNALSQKLALVQNELSLFEKAEKELNSSLQTAQNESDDKNQGLGSLVAKEQKLIHRLHELQIKTQEAVTVTRTLQEEAQKLELTKTSILKLTEALQGEIVLAKASFDRVCAKLKETLSSASQSKSTLTEHTSTKDKLHEKVLSLKNEGEKASLQLAQIDERLAEIEKEIQERFEGGLEEITLEEPLDDVEKEVKRLRKIIEGASNINLSSIDDAEAVQKRAQDLHSQLLDLRAGKDELCALIDEIEKESSRLFHESFEKVRAAFTKSFGVLFEGGQADLQIVSVGENMEVGVEIIAKPPGKKMRSLQLLSGGEKCLTAIALLFAFFEVRPSPFCLLDEVDAPLDDANVGRFINVVQHYLRSTQFIIVTHNKKTMSIADALFGVSMEEKGVSKLLAMKLAKNEKVEELSLV